MTEFSAFEPNWVSPPGDTIEDILEVKGWTKRELAQRMDYSEKHINQLTSGEAALSEDAALRLETVLGGTARFWLAREADYREALARDEAETELEKQTEWLAELPLRDMRKYGWISKTRDKIQQVRECLQFFGVAHVGAWRAQYSDPLTAFRASGSFKLKPGAVAAWIRHGELEAERLSCAPWDKTRFAETVRELRSLTLIEEPASFVPRLTELCASCGVAVVISPAPKGCPAFGMTKWLSPHKALLMLSLRYKTHDHLWFAFFHEAGHLLLHGKRLTIIEGLEGLDDELEAEADRFAANLLIPPPVAAELAALPSAPGGVRAFARTIGVHPGIVVGRLQHEGLLKFNQLNDLKVRYDW